MTKLSSRKTRLTFATDTKLRYRGKLRAVVVEVDNGFTASVRLAGTRQRYSFSWEGLFVHAADRFARQECDRKKKERAERRKGR